MADAQVPMFKNLEDVYGTDGNLACGWLASDFLHSFWDVHVSKMEDPDNFLMPSGAALAKERFDALGSAFLKRFGALPQVYGRAPGM